MASSEPTRRGSFVAPDRTDVRAAWHVSMLSVAWTLAVGCGAIAIGFREASAALVAFGAVGSLDAAGSAALAYHFHHGLRHDALAAHLEVAAHRVVVVGLVTVGTAAVVFGSWRFADGQASGSSIIGSSLAGVSLIVLVMLARRKIQLARRVGSGALRSDGHLSAVGATEAAVTLAGVATTAIGWHWADPLAAIAVGTVAVIVGAQAWWTDLRSGAGV